MLNGNLTSCPLFAGIHPDELPGFVAGLTAERRQVARGDFLLRAGDPVRYVGIVLTGRTQVVTEDFWGNRNLLTEVLPGDLFGEAFLCAGADRLPVSVEAAEDSLVLLLHGDRVLRGEGENHRQLMGNMVGILARKNVALTRKIEHVAGRTTRQKLLSYLSYMAGEAGSAAFTIPLSRQALADYLAVDRSAMSSALSAMGRDGLLRYRRNDFELLRD